MRQYNVCTYEMFYRSVQDGYAYLIDPERSRVKVTSRPIAYDELPVFEHYMGKQVSDPAYLTVVKDIFDRTYAEVCLSSVAQQYYLKNYPLPPCVSLVDLRLVPPKRVKKTAILPVWNYPQFPCPPFGPARPGAYLYELLYAQSFPYSRGGVTFIGGTPEDQVSGEEELPRALVIDFERFIPYRGGGRNANFYNRMRPYAGASDAVTGRRVVALFNKNFNHDLVPQQQARYYKILSDQLGGRYDSLLETMFVMPLNVLRRLKAASSASRIKHVEDVRKPPRVKKKPLKAAGSPPVSRRPFDASNIMVQDPPAGCGLSGEDFQFLWARKRVYISPSWPFVYTDLSTRSSDPQALDFMSHGSRVFVQYHVLANLPGSQEYWSAALDDWLQRIVRCNVFEFMALLRHQRRTNPLKNIERVTSEAKGLRFLPEEDEVIRKLYRPHMTQQQVDAIKAVCLGRRWASIKRRALRLRDTMLAAGITDMSLIPHRSRTELVLKRVRASVRTANKSSTDS